FSIPLIAIIRWRYIGRGEVNCSHSNIDEEPLSIDGQWCVGWYDSTPYSIPISIKSGR
ncbi:hypothetical protein RDWZM_008161, partial [Blomia tropicalis]